MKIIPEYNSSGIPLSRNEIANNLRTIYEKLNQLNSIENKILNDFEIEFEYDIYGTTKKQYSAISRERFGNIFNDKKQKHLYFCNDSNVTLFTDLNGSLSRRGSDGDSLKTNSLLLGQYGFEARGTFFRSTGYFLKLFNGRILQGDDSDIVFANETDVILRSNKDFLQKKNFNSIEAYLRYQTKSNWLSLTFGRTPLNMGFGYIDKMYLSNNTAPIDFAKIDLNYKAVSYSFLYGNINGDSAGIHPRTLSSKNIATHRMNINFSNAFKLGLWEAVIISEQAFSFTYLNPVSFLTSADLSIGKEQTTENNTLLGIDFEVVPLKNFSVQSTLLIDDLTFGTLSKDDSLNENKFGWQIGTYYVSPVNFNLSVEFTHLDPFVYSHRSNKSTYTNNALSLGHALPPNSDEIASKITYDITSRLRATLLYQHQRSGEGIEFDSSGNIIANYGGNINFGLGDAYLRTNSFLDGNRINRDVFTAEIFWEPVKQFFLEGKFQYRIINDITSSLKFKDSYYLATIKIVL